MADKKDSIQIILESLTGYDVKAEWRFHNLRRWRFDYAIPALKIALEFEGGLHIMGRHTRGQGYINDMEKYNAAAKEGWTVLRYAPYQTDKMLGEVEEYVKSLKKGGSR